MRLLLLAALMTVALPAMADKLTIDRLFDGPDLAGAAPRMVTISPDGRRVGFLRPQPDHPRRYDLWAYDRRDHRLRKLLDAGVLMPGAGQLSPDEQSRRERERTAALEGIVSYRWSPDGHRLLLPVGGALYLYDLDAPRQRALHRLASHGAVVDPRFSPEGHYVSYVQDQNLWVIDLADGRARQLTFDGGGTVHNGEAEFVAQEEMDRSRGYWWAPDESAIAFERYDAADVPLTRRLDIDADRAVVVEQHYPFAGDPNVRVQLGLVAPTGGDARWIDLGADPDIYLARVKWLPDGDRLSYQRLSRDQKHLTLRLVDTRDPALPQRTLLSETSATWIALNHDLHFLRKQDAFIWGSERSGWHHLYLYGLDGTLKHAIGSGAWRIDGLLAVDEAKGRVYVSSNRDFAPDRQLYALALDGSDGAHPRRVSQRDGTHLVEFADDASFYVDTFSDPTTPPQVSVHEADGRFVSWVEENRLDATHPYWPYLDSHVVPAYGTLQASDGQTLYYRLYKPLDFDPNKRYPVVDYVYGGPGVQMVSRAWVDTFCEYMAQHGFVVFSLDNRGMARRGRRFAEAIAGQLGVAEVDDQIRGIAWLQQQPWVDARRIGMFGWSYGGYLTTMMLAKDSADLAGGVAVAPVVDWRLYDTFYTERYLGQPLDNPAGYARSSPLAWLDGLTSPLFLAHGMADDNVLFRHSTELMAALQQRGTPFQLMTYPGGKHGLDRPGERQHLFHMIADFFRRTVAGRCAACARTTPTSADAPHNTAALTGD